MGGQGGSNIQLKLQIRLKDRHAKKGHPTELCFKK